MMLLNLNQNILHFYNLMYIFLVQRQFQFILWLGHLDLVEFCP